MRDNLLKGEKGVRPAMAMRSLLFVPAGRAGRLDEALRALPDALVFDLEDSVAPEAKEAARRSVLAALREFRSEVVRPRLLVRINALSTPLADGDLDVVMTAAPDAIMLPKAEGGADIAILDARLALREALHGIADGATGIIAIATETPAAMFALGTYPGCSPRLEALAWSAGDLAAAMGTSATRAGEDWTSPMAMARGLALMAAAAAGIAAIDTAFPMPGNLEALRRECDAAARDGFAGKLAIHPAQVAIIHEAFAPSAEAIAHAKAVIDVLDAAGAAEVAVLDGVMLHRPQRLAAERLLARASSVPQGPVAEAPATPPEPPISA